MSLLVLVLCAGAYRSNLDYRYEVIGLLLTWLVLIATGALVPLGLRSAEKCDSATQLASDDQRLQSVGHHGRGSQSGQ